MDSALTLAGVMGPLYLAIGLSILFNAKSWHTILDKWEKDHYLLFPLMFGFMLLGLLSIRMYNVWAWNVWLLITLTGWALFLEGVYYFLASGPWVMKLLGMKKNMNCLYVGGVVCVVIGIVLSYYVYLV